MLTLTVLLWNLLAIGSCSTGPGTITAERGQNITLPCRAPDNRPVLVVEWSRTDLGSDYVLLYRDDQINQGLQHSSYQNRVDLQDRQMKDGDVSLVLKNVMINDAGTYECRVVYNEPDRIKELINTIHLSVRSPDNKDGRGDHGGNKDGDNRVLGLIALGPVLAVIIAAVVYRCIKKKNSHDSAPQEKETEASESLKENQNGD